MKNNLRNRLRARGGFTLVELVVVIAIMAILAGIGTVAYTGYITYTNEKLDEKLYNEILYAGNVGHYSDTSASGTITVTKDKAKAGGTDKEVVEQWMENAFGADWQDTVRLKTDKIKIENVPMPYGILNADQLEELSIYGKSNWVGKEEDLQASVVNVTQAFTGFLGSTGKSAQGALKQFLGSDEALKVFMDAYDLDENSSLTQFSNAVVLQVAKETAEKKEGLMKMLNGEDPGDDFDLSTLTSMALSYGVASGYANSAGSSTEFKTLYGQGISNYTDLENLFTKLQGETDEKGEYVKQPDSGYSAYLQATEKGYTADVKGYVATLCLLNDYAGTITNGDLANENLYSDAKITELLNTILSNQSRTN